MFEFVRVVAYTLDVCGSKSRPAEVKSGLCPSSSSTCGRLYQPLVAPKTASKNCSICRTCSTWETTAGRGIFADL